MVAQDSFEDRAREVLEKTKKRGQKLKNKATAAINAYTKPRQESGPPPLPIEAVMQGAVVPPIPVEASMFPPPLPPEAKVEGDETLDLEALRHKAGELLGQAKRQTKVVGQQISSKTDRKATQIAAVVSKKLGREITPSQVKKVALVAGIALLAAGATDIIAENMMEKGTELISTDSLSPTLQGSGSVVDDAGMWIAENGGSLNIEHITVDVDGCQI